MAFAAIVWSVYKSGIHLLTRWHALRPPATVRTASPARRRRGGPARQRPPPSPRSPRWVPTQPRWQAASARVRGRLPMPGRSISGLAGRAFENLREHSCRSGAKRCAQRANGAVNAGERETDRERHTETQRERKREKERDTERHRERERERKRETETEREREEKERQKYRERRASCDGFTVIMCSPTPCRGRGGPRASPATASALGTHLGDASDAHLL